MYVAVQTESHRGKMPAISSSVRGMNKFGHKTGCPARKHDQNLERLSHWRGHIMSRCLSPLLPSCYWTKASLTVVRKNSTPSAQQSSHKTTTFPLRTSSWTSKSSSLQVALSFRASIILTYFLTNWHLLSVSTIFRNISQLCPYKMVVNIYIYCN